jgi:hypothetical protein
MHTVHGNSSPDQVLTRGVFVPTTINDVLNQWRLGRERGAAAPPGANPYAPRGLLTRHMDRGLDEIHLLGKEGDLLVERQRGVVAVDEAVTVYGTNTGVDLVWRAAVGLIARLDQAEVAAVAPEVSRSQRWRWVSRRAVPDRRLRGEVIERLRRRAVRELSRASQPIPEDAAALLTAHSNLLDERPPRCMGCGEVLPSHRRLYHDERCRSLARRLST